MKKKNFFITFTPFITIAVSACILSFSFISCTNALDSSQQSANNNSALSQVEKETLPNMQIALFKTLSYKKDSLTWQLVSKSAEVFEDKKITKVVDANIVFFNIKREPVSFVQAKDVILENDTRNILMKTNVHIKNTKGTSIKGHTFYWNNNTEKLTSDDEVELTKSNGFKIIGRGFTTDKNLESIHFQSQVSGKVEASGNNEEEDFFNVEFGE